MTVTFERSSQVRQNIVIGFARMEGQSVGIGASQPGVALDIRVPSRPRPSCVFCDAFNIPVIVCRCARLHAARKELLDASSSTAPSYFMRMQSTVPRDLVITRKAWRRTT
jgi:propionyl-CoA carboxylase beta chain